jgi:hypothetical protein
MSQGKYQSKRRKQRKNRYLFPVLLAVGGVLLITAAVLGLSRGGGRPANFTPEVAGAPSLKTDQETVDLGDVKLGQMVQVEYQLTNVGDETLRFSQNPYIEVVEGC